MEGPQESCELSPGPRRSRPPRSYPQAAAFAALAILASAGVSHAAEAEPKWRVARSDLSVVCWLTVGGSFEAQSHSLSGEIAFPKGSAGALDGTLTVDARTLDTGIGLRTTHLRENYLEVGKGAGYEKIELTDIRLADAKDASFEGKTAFAGVLTLHGIKKSVAGEADIRRNGGSIVVSASFPVTVADFGIPKPRYLGVGVKEKVLVRVSFTADPVGDAR